MPGSLPDAWSMQYVGPPFVYSFTVIGSGCGLIGKATGGKHVLKRRILVQEHGGGFCADAARAGELVRRITAQRDKVGNLRRLDAVALAHFGRPDPRHLSGANRMKDRRGLGGELKGVPVAARHECCAAAPLQEAGAVGLGLPETYYKGLAEAYRKRRDRLIPVLTEIGFRCFHPRGAYYVMTDISAFGFANDLEFTKYMVEEVGVAVVPGSSFYSGAQGGAQQVRFAFCKRDETLDAAAKRLQRLRARK